MFPSSAALPPRGDVRVGDRERAEAADRLAAHAAAGRLGVEELEQRLERVHAAVLARDLTALEADLPGPIAVRERRPGGPAWLLAAALTCLAAGVALTVLVGHPVPPLLIAVFLLWRWAWHAPFRAIGAWR
jgi:hypothetical protein